MAMARVTATRRPMDTATAGKHGIRAVAHLERCGRKDWRPLDSRRAGRLSFVYRPLYRLLARLAPARTSASLRFAPSIKPRQSGAGLSPCRSTMAQAEPHIRLPPFRMFVSTTEHERRGGKMTTGRSFRQSNWRTASADLCFLQCPNCEMQLIAAASARFRALFGGDPLARLLRPASPPDRWSHPRLQKLKFQN